MMWFCQSIFYVRLGRNEQVKVVSNSLAVVFISITTLSTMAAVADHGRKPRINAKLMGSHQNTVV
jgi:hypothetical protein